MKRTSHIQIRSILLLYSCACFFSCHVRLADCWRQASSNRCYQHERNEQPIACRVCYVCDANHGMLEFGVSFILCLTLFPRLMIVFQLDEDNIEHTKVSKVNLVDLAGSERSDAAGTTGVRLRVCSSLWQ